MIWGRIPKRACSSRRSALSSVVYADMYRWSDRLQFVFPCSSFKAAAYDLISEFQIQKVSRASVYAQADYTNRETTVCGTARLYCNILLKLAASFLHTGFLNFCPLTLQSDIHRF